ncbi:ribosomal protein 63, mitochondrial [Callorhinchus milii]|uniref:Mitochondrial ribosomal protein L57 n=1 Tax=Callorhinchus milii TaxID=7868 RepID=A0A4W3H791_CALMI|nr:ribosomal protein 63, mitochondrial [Callorhinchus milii]|eukprot:gi/632950366/ref/XP_007890675.1/ PREDICTED: ribosomal protein 63, mitochondrial [Callorhinchus milii]
MFLTSFLLRKGIPGKQWLGKYRRPRPITWQMKRNMINRLEIERENEYWLSRPWMSSEQEKGHSAVRRAERWEAFKIARAAKFPENKCIEEHLQHLNVTKTWGRS